MPDDSRPEDGFYSVDDRVRKSAERDQLFHQLSRGQIGPEEAEQIALRSGLKPLHKPINSLDYDPMDEPSWSPEMALAWIMWRTADAVRKHWNRYRRERFKWRQREYVVADENGEPQTGLGSFLEHDNDTSVALMGMEVEVSELGEAGDPPPLISFARAKQELTKSLIDADLSAMAVCIPNCSLTEIPALQWTQLDWVTDSKDRDNLFFEANPMYRDITFRG